MHRSLLICVLLISILMVNVVEAAKINALFYGQNQEVISDNQIFLFENLMLNTQKEDYINTVHLNLYGSITNNSDTNWASLLFKVNFCDKNNNMIYSDTLKVRSLNKSELGRIGKDVSSYSSSGDWYISTDQPQVLSRIKDIAKIDITYINGEPKTRTIIQMVKPVKSKDLDFNDDYIDIKFNLGGMDSSFGIELLNKTDNPIKIDWSQVSYVNTSGIANSVIHEGVKLVDSAKPQTPTLIPPTARIKDVIAPTSNFYYDDKWEYVPILPEGKKAITSIDKPFSIFIPIEINGVIKNYLFTFKISEVLN